MVTKLSLASTLRAHQGSLVMLMSSSSLTSLTPSHSSADAQRDNAAAGRWTRSSFLQRTSAFADLSEDTESSAVFHLSPSGISPLFSTVRLQLGDEFSPVSVLRRLYSFLSHGASSARLYQPFIIFHIASIMLPSLHLLNANAVHLQRENAVEEDSLLLFESALSG